MPDVNILLRANFWLVSVKTVQKYYSNRIDTYFLSYILLRIGAVSRLFFAKTPSFLEWE